MHERNSPDAPVLGMAGHFRSILDSLPNGVLTVDSDWRVTSLNVAAQRLLGISEDDARGRLCRKVMRSDVCIGECPLRVTLETGQGVYDYEVTSARADGSPLQLSVNTAVLRDAAGTPIGGVVAFRDVTMTKRMAEDLLGRCHFHRMIGSSRAMRELYGLIEDVAPSNATVLIQGESGTGKELVARAIQSLSPRNKGPFIRVNCAAFAETLLESELFGHVRGAFTDAHRDRPGRFEQADGGTLFLDEIGEASPGVQLRLLRVLQEQEFERVGGNETIRVDVRVLAASHRPLTELIGEGRFRQDLFYRLNVIPIRVPPLRERLEDVRLLADHFLRRHGLLTGRPIRGFTPRALACLMDHSWPGNVRELENTIEHVCVRCHGGLVREKDLPDSLRHRSADRVLLREPGSREPGIRSSRNDEPDRLLLALQGSRWNRSQAAGRLGISRTTLWRRMVACGLLEGHLGHSDSLHSA